MNRTIALIIAAVVATLVGLAPASLPAQASSTEQPAPAEKIRPATFLTIRSSSTTAPLWDSNSKCPRGGLGERPLMVSLSAISTTRSLLSCHNAPTR
jgi:hypothetical protein